MLRREPDWFLNVYDPNCMVVGSPVKTRAHSDYLLKFMQANYGGTRPLYRLRIYLKPPQEEAP